MNIHLHKLSLPLWSLRKHAVKIGVNFFQDKGSVAESCKTKGCLPCIDFLVLQPVGTISLQPRKRFGSLIFCIPFPENGYRLNGVKRTLRCEVNLVVNLVCISASFNFEKRVGHLLFASTRAFHLRENHGG